MLNGTLFFQTEDLTTPRDHSITTSTKRGGKFTYGHVSRVCRVHLSTQPNLGGQSWVKIGSKLVHVVVECPLTFNCAMNLHKKCNWQDGKTVWLCNIPKANIKSCYPIWKKKHASKGHIWSAKQKIQTNGHDRLLLSLLSQRTKEEIICLENI